MSFRRRTSLLPALLALLTALVVGACGGGDEAASSEDVNALLEQTFSGDKKIESGVVDLKLALDAKGGAQDGSFDMTLAGPFQSQGGKQLPKFAMTAKVTGQGQNIEAGATSTGDKGFVAFNGQQYAVSDQVFAEFKRGYEQAQAQQGGKQDQSLASLGIDPRKWLVNPQNEGEVEVGGEETIKITGGVNVARLLDDVNNALRRASELGASGGQVPERLTDAQKRQVQDAVKRLDVEIYTGANDKILRRMVVDADVDAMEAQQRQQAAVNLNLTLTGVNEDQEIEAPANARPFEELAQQLGNLGLGGLGGGGGQSGGAGSGAGGGASSQALEKYSQCIRDAGNDAAKAQKCADLLTAP